LVFCEAVRPCEPPFYFVAAQSQLPRRRCDGQPRGADGVDGDGLYLNVFFPRPRPPAEWRSDANYTIIRTDPFFVFENCIFYKTTKPSLLMGQHVGLVLFKNVKINGAVIQNAEQLERAGVDLSAPVKFEP
jgi:hypothetical protein